MLEKLHRCVYGKMLVKKKRPKARVLQVAPHINFTYCMIHRE
uniref:Uncharacterized protein n=1 Tax=Lepeophtheirus salmonis TaxID=72036 RepID=A0A0K2T0L1_LEPSM